MNDQYLIRWFKEQDLSFYIDGLNQNLYDCYDEDRFRWKMVNIPFSLGFVPIVVIEYESKPVAFNSFLPLKIRYGSDKFNIVQGCDGFVHTDHRRMGLFQETLRFMTSELINKGPLMLLGFNFAGATGAAQKAGSSITSDIERMVVKPSQLHQFKTYQEVTIEEIDINELGRIYESWANYNNFFHIYRTIEYLKWRYSHPIRNSSFFCIRYNDIVGYVTFSLEFEYDKTSNIFIEDYTTQMSNTKIISSVLDKLLKTHDNINEITITTPSNSKIFTTSLSLGFQPDSSYTLIMKKIAGLESMGDRLFRNGLELTDIRNWHITCSDVY